METFVKRMLDESKDLEGKANRLEKFINDKDPQAKFKTLSATEQELDKKQLEYMKGYLDVLDKRIEIHNPGWIESKKK